MDMQGSSQKLQLTTK